MDSGKQRVVIIGGGVIGMCSAYYAVRRGFDVTVLDRDKPDAESCSTGNAGMIVPSHFIPLAAPGMLAKGLRWMLNRRSPFFVRPRIDPALARWGWLFCRHSTIDHVKASQELLRDLNMESRRLFSELSAEEDFGLIQKGLLMLCRTQKGLDGEAEVAEEAKRIGLDAEVLDSRKTALADPDITMEVAGSVYFRDDCHLDPARFLTVIRRKASSLGARIIHGVDVTHMESSGDRITAAVTKEEQFDGVHFIIAGGSWSARLLKKLGIRLPLQPGKGYSLTLNSPPELPQLCSIFTEDKVAITPMGGTLRFGGTMEVGSLDRKVDPLRVQGIVQSVPRYFPRFSESDFKDIAPWAGLRPVSPDGVPYLGKTKRYQNLIVNTGHAMMGLSMAPISGRLAADILAEDEPFRPIEALSPDRF